MERTRVSSKGQVVLPKSVREDYGWPAGTVLEIDRGPASVSLRKADSIPVTTVEDVSGFLKYNGPPISLEDMERGIDAAMRERWRRKSR
jgi:AbrB family looped-hinge helix DNA binding protein